MTTKFNIENIVREIETITGQKATKYNKLGVEYSLPNITESQLIEDLKFVYTGKSFYTKCPTYTRENIFAFFNGNLLHILELF